MRLLLGMRLMGSRLLAGLPRILTTQTKDALLTEADERITEEG